MKNTVSKPAGEPGTDTSEQTQLTPEERRERYRRLGQVLQEWMEEEDDGYDEWIGPLLDEELENNPVRFREP